MKTKIFLYLFIFASLLALFQFMNSKKLYESYEARITSLKNKIEKQNKEKHLSDLKIDSLINANMDLTYFSLSSDEEAISYFEDQGFDVNKLSITISDQIIEQNKPGKDNPIVPFEGMEGNMAINKVRLLNHKWIIADFTDGVYWGQLFITYEVSKEATVTFEVQKSFLYPKS